MGNLNDERFEPEFQGIKKGATAVRTWERLFFHTNNYY